jgi:hypothetical protein
MPREDKNVKLEHIKGRYGIIIAFVTGISGALAIPFLCTKDAQPDTAAKQKVEIATNQNSPVTGEIETQNNYYNTTLPDSTAAKQPTKSKSRKAVPTTTPPGKDKAGTVYAPNASIVTQNQSGGTNTVIVADSYERKLAALKVTPPEASFQLYLKDSILYADVELKNDVPVNFRLHVNHEDDGSPVYYLKESKTLYPERQKSYTINIGKIYWARFDYPPLPLFKRIITVDIRSIYADEMGMRSLWKKSNKVYQFNLTNQTLTLTKDVPVYRGSLLIYPDPTKNPWEYID